MINDLDLRITKGDETFYPYKLHFDGTSFEAVKNDNNIDNVEHVEIENAATGNYTVTVTHKGKLQEVGGNPFQNFDQAFSLILTGDGLTLSNSNVNWSIGNMVTVYPIPAEENVFIELSEHHTENLKKVFLYNFDGKLLLTKELDKESKSIVFPLKTSMEGLISSLSKPISVSLISLYLLNIVFLKLRSII